MLAGNLKAAILLNTEPEFDSASGAAAVKGLSACQMVVSMSPFKANMAFCDVVLPIAPFTETPGTFINAEGRLQSFHAVVKPLADTRPAWKVLRVLGNMLGVAGFNAESAQDVLARLLGVNSGQAQLPSSVLSNAGSGAIELVPADRAPVSAAIYQLDSIVRRAASLQMTADAKSATQAEGALA
jgi:NADH-quinone oxidoreductase subunit G